jgi:HEC/Ndc80p family
MSHEQPSIVTSHQSPQLELSLTGQIASPVLQARIPAHVPTVSIYMYDGRAFGRGQVRGPKCRSVLCAGLREVAQPRCSALVVHVSLLRSLASWYIRSESTRMENRRRTTIVSTSDRGRASTALGPANGQTRSRSRPRKDPRDIAEKGYQKEAKHDIIAFLAEQRYPHDVSMKKLACPTQKEFFAMFGFILNNIDLTAPKDIGNTTEGIETVMSWMKRLKYPFMPSKSTVQAVSSPIYWPQGLAMLDWLVGFAHYMVARREEEARHPVRCSCKARRCQAAGPSPFLCPTWLHNPMQTTCRMASGCVACPRQNRGD